MHQYLKFAKHIFIMGSLDILSAIQGFIFLPLITKLLGTADFGIWSQIKITVSLLVSFTFLGLHEAIIRFIPGTQNKEDAKEGIYSSLWITSSISILLALLLFVFSQSIAIFLKFDSLFVKLLSLIIIFESANNILFVTTRALREIGKYFLFSIIRIFGEIAFVVFAVLTGFGLEGAVFSLLFIRVIIFCVLIAYIIKKIGIKIPDFSLVKKYLLFGLPTIADSFSYWIITSSDRYLIGFFLGIVFVGYYAPAYSVAYLLSFFIFPVSSILSIVLPKLFDNNNLEETKKYLSYSLKYFLLLAVPSVFGLSLLSKQILLIFSNKEISDNGFLVIPFIATSIVIYGISYFFSQILVLKKKTKLIALIWMIAAILNLFLNIVFIPLFGILAAAIGTLLSYVLAFILMVKFAFSEFKFKIEWLFISKIFASSLLMTFAILIFNLKGYFIFVSIVLGAIIYLVLMLCFQALGKKEIIFLKNLIYEMAIFSK